MDTQAVETSNLSVEKGEDKKVEVVLRDENGRFIHGHPDGGRPPGAKNKFTRVKEALVDAFNEAGGAEAFKNTLIYDMKGSDGKSVKFINLKALNAVLRVLPQDINVTGENTINFNLIVAELKNLSKEELRAIVARGQESVGFSGAEGSGPSGSADAD